MTNSSEQRIKVTLSKVNMKNISSNRSMSDGRVEYEQKNPGPGMVTKVRMSSVQIPLSKMENVKKGVNDTFMINFTKRFTSARRTCSKSREHLIRRAIQQTNHRRCYDSLGLIPVSKDDVPDEREPANVQRFDYGRFMCLKHAKKIANLTEMKETVIAWTGLKKGMVVQVKFSGAEANNLKVVGGPTHLGNGVTTVEPFQFGARNNEFFTVTDDVLALDGVTQIATNAGATFRLLKLYAIDRSDAETTPSPNNQPTRANLETAFTPVGVVRVVGNKIEHEGAVNQEHLRKRGQVLATFGTAANTPGVVAHDSWSFVCRTTGALANWEKEVPLRATATVGEWGDDGNLFRFDGMHDLESQAIACTPTRFKNTATEKDQNELKFSDNWHAIVVDAGNYTPAQLAHEMTLKVRQFLLNKTIEDAPADLGELDLFEDMTYSTTKTPLSDAKETTLVFETVDYGSATTGDNLLLCDNVATLLKCGASPKEQALQTENDPQAIITGSLDVVSLRPVPTLFALANDKPATALNDYVTQHNGSCTTNYSLSDRNAEILRVAQQLAIVQNPDDEHFYFMSIGSSDFSYQENLARTESQKPGHLKFDYDGEAVGGGAPATVGSTVTNLAERKLCSAMCDKDTDPDPDLLRRRNNNKYVCDYVCSARIRRVMEKDLDTTDKTYNKAHLDKYGGVLASSNGDRGLTFGVGVKDGDVDDVYPAYGTPADWDENFAKDVIHQKKLVQSLSPGFQSVQNSRDYGRTDAMNASKKQPGIVNFGSDTLTDGRGVGPEAENSVASFQFKQSSAWWAREFVRIYGDTFFVRPVLQHPRGVDGLIPALSNSLNNPFSRPGKTGGEENKVSISTALTDIFGVVTDDLKLRSTFGYEGPANCDCSEVKTVVGNRLPDDGKGARLYNTESGRSRYVLHRMTTDRPTCGMPTHLYVCFHGQDIPSYTPQGTSGMLHEAALPYGSTGDYVFNLQGGGRSGAHVSGGGNASFHKLPVSHRARMVVNPVITVYDQDCKGLTMSEQAPPTFTLEYIGTAS